VQRNWSPLVKEGIRSHLVGRGFFVFVFDNLEDKNLIFRNGPYFMGPQGLYLNKWSPDFDPTQDVPSVVPVWVRLPHLPLHCWNPKSLESIGNTLGKYIDKADRKEQYSCARICIEVDLEVGLPEAIQLKVADWSHIQELDYEQLPFKCRYCHGYNILPDIAKRRSRRRWRSRKAINGHRSRKQPRQSITTDPKGKGHQRGLAPLPQGKLLGKGAQPLQSQRLLKTLSKSSTIPQKYLIQ
jgi:hypothetical protein